MVSRAQLTLEQGDAQPETYVLDPDKPALIGRHKTNQIVLVTSTLRGNTRRSISGRLLVRARY